VFLGSTTGRSIKRLDAGASTAMELQTHSHCSRRRAKQINHVKSMRAMTKALTRKQNNTQKEIGCRLFLLARLPVKLDSSAVRHHPFYFFTTAHSRSSSNQAPLQTTSIPLAIVNSHKHSKSSNNSLLERAVQISISRIRQSGSVPMWQGSLENY